MANLNSYGTTSIDYVTSGWSWSDATLTNLLDGNNGTGLIGSGPTSFVISRYVAGAQLKVTLPGRMKITSVTFRYSFGGSVSISRGQYGIALNYGVTYLNGQFGGVVGGVETKTWTGSVSGVDNITVSIGENFQGFSAGQTLNASFFEVTILGSPYGDSGFHVRNGSTTRVIGCTVDGSTSPLRIQTPSGLRYIPLLSTGDSEASPLRIRKGAVTYALAEVK